MLLTIIYLSFICLGLPDTLLGSAWPIMHQSFDVPVSYAGIISTTISIFTILSSLMSVKLIRRLGTGKLTACSVALSMVALFGFSFARSFPVLFLWTIPYGLGAGGVDAALNNYVALHFKSWHMNWLHCMWGVGAATGPYIMSWVLSSGQPWKNGYRITGSIQLVLTIILFLTLPRMMDRSSPKSSDAPPPKDLSYFQILKIPGAKEVIISFFCYLAVENTIGLWSSSYMVYGKGVPEAVAASFVGCFYMGLTIGRGMSGFISFKLTNVQIIRLGSVILTIGVLALFLPFGNTCTLIALILCGLGCAPIYPCIVHSTPEHFGAENSQSVIGMQMASAYVGGCVMPPLYGFLQSVLSPLLLPYYVVILLALMIVTHELLVRKTVPQ